MNLQECREMIKSLETENDPTNNDLILFYKEMESKLIRMINEKVQKYGVEIN